MIQHSQGHSPLPINITNIAGLPLSTKIRIAIAVLRSKKLLPLPTLNFLLLLKDTSIHKICAQVDVSKQAAYADIRGGKPAPRFRDAIKSILGFVPWE